MQLPRILIGDLLGIVMGAGREILEFDDGWYMQCFESAKDV